MARARRQVWCRTRSPGGWEGSGRYPHDRWAAVICQVVGIAFEDCPAPPGSSAPPVVTASLDSDDPRPWMRVARTLLERIGRGELRAGERVPRAADSGREAGVSVPTVRLAYAYLEGRGVIRYRPGTGYHVSGGPMNAGIRRTGKGPPCVTGEQAVAASTVRAGIS